MVQSAARSNDQRALATIRQEIERSLRGYQEQMSRVLQFASLNRAAHYIETRDRGGLTPAQQACADFEL